MKQNPGVGTPLFGKERGSLSQAGGSGEQGFVV